MTIHKAERLPVQQGPAAWNAILPAQPCSAPLEGALRVDVAIVGGGFAGLSAAKRLRQQDPSLRIAVLEASGLAEGASGRNSGFMIDLPHDLQSDDYAGKGVEEDKKMIALNRAAISFAKERVEEYGIDPAYFDQRARSTEQLARPHATSTQATPNTSPTWAKSARRWTPRRCKR